MINSSIGLWYTKYNNFVLDLPPPLLNSVYKGGIWQWWIQGTGPGGRSPFFLVGRAEKRNFETGPPLIWRSGSVTTWRKRKQIITESRHFVFYVTFKGISWYVKGNAVYFLPAVSLGMETSSNCRGLGIPISWIKRHCCSSFIPDRGLNASVALAC